MSNDDTEDFDIDLVKAETDKAFLLVFEDGEERWIPKTCIYTDDVEKGAEGITVSIFSWFAKKEGFSER